MTPLPTTMLAHALFWAARGFPVFPLQPGSKLPLAGSDGHLSATTDPDVIRSLWTDSLTGKPRDCNVGLSPRDGRHLILDLDYKNGVDGIKAFEALGGEIAGLVVRTPSGGLHIYFATTAAYRTGAGRIAPGIDTRASDGYVVAPGSMIDGRTYELIQDDAPLPLPGWLAALVGTRADRDAHRMITRYSIDSDAANNVARAIEIAQRAEPAVSGCWHDYGFKLGTEMCRVGLSPEMAVTVLAEHWLPRGEGFKSFERFEADVLGGYHDAERKGEHGAHSCDRQIAALQGVTITPAPDDIPDAAQPPPAAPAGPGWVFQDLTTLQDRAVAPRRWIVEGWLSPGHCTLLYGDGSVGKSLVMMQLQTAAATGRLWCGMDVEPCDSVGLFCEDPTDELHRRQEAINRAAGIEFRDLAAMTWASGVGQDNTFLSFDRDGAMIIGAAFNRLCAEARRRRSRMIMLDTAACLYAGDENQRRQVSLFLGTVLGSLALELDAAIVLAAHPSRAGLNSGSLDGGSTAWNNSARARWTLSRAPAVFGVTDPDARILSKRKSNYAALGDDVRLRWEKGVFVAKPPPTQDSLTEHERRVEVEFMRLMNREGLDGRSLSPVRLSRTFAPRVMSRNTPEVDLSEADFEAAMRRLVLGGRVLEVETRKDGKSRKTLETRH